MMIVGMMSTMKPAWNVYGSQEKYTGIYLHNIGLNRLFAVCLLFVCLLFACLLFVTSMISV